MKLSAYKGYETNHKQPKKEEFEMRRKRLSEYYNEMKLNSCNGEFLPTGKMTKGFTISLGWSGDVGKEVPYEKELYACNECGHKVKEDYAEYRKMKCNKSRKRNKNN